jgi:ankyrin repeat protein
MPSDLFEAIRAGDEQRVHSLVAANADLLNATDINGVSALLTAVYTGHRALAEALVARGAQVNVFEAAALNQAGRLATLLDESADRLHAHSSDGWTALHLACFFGAGDAAGLLIRRGADVASWSKNAMHNTALNAAASGGHAEIVKTLLADGAPVDAQQAGGFTALHTAAYQGNVEMTRALLAAGADPDIKNDAGQTAMDMALAKGRQAVVDLLNSAAN